MCGITGFWAPDHQSAESLKNVARNMADSLRHRGPDDAGVWVDADRGLALGHRRLAILDLSPAGHQPMASSSGRYVVSFNGEIYNHLELRKDLDCDILGGLASTVVGSELSYGAPNVIWRGHSDTETLLAGFERWGIEATLQRCVGMFAIALWDKHANTLTLARDRFGEKPIYYGWVGSDAAKTFVFGSELKALRAYPGFVSRVSREALAQYLRFMYVPAPLSIYESIYKLEPGCLLTLPGLRHGIQITRWWSLADAVQAGARDPIEDEAEAVNLLEVQLGEAVRLQSLADVPLGAFLSGGVDSSAIVALMQKQSSFPVKTFTIGFEEAPYDESNYARAVAQHLGTLHSELYVTTADARNVIPQLPTMYDEPFADSSQIPTYLVSKAARQHVTVALSGDAGDELFGGYNRYFWGPRIWNRLAWIPSPVRKTLGSAIAALPTASWDILGAPLNVLLPGAHGITRLGDKAHKLAERLRNVRDLDDLYTSLVTEWQVPSALVQQEIGSSFAMRDNEQLALGRGETSAAVRESPCIDPVERMMYRDIMTYLPDDILLKVDRAAMACSLETRVPFLDHRVAELAWRLPLHMKIRGNTGKWALREVLYKYVPRELIERPKMGFGIPVGMWLRGPLRDWAEALLDPVRMNRQGYLKPEPIQTVWQQHLKGHYDWTSRLWSVLMFQAWLEENT